MAAKDHGLNALDRDPDSIGEEAAQTGRIQHPSHATHHVGRKACDLLHGIDHRIKWVGNDDDKSAGAVLFQVASDVLDDRQVNTDQIVAAHPRLTGNPCSNDDHIGTGHIGIVGSTRDVSIVAVDRPTLSNVQGFAFGNPFCRGDVQQNNVSELFLTGQKRHYATDLTSTNQCNLRALLTHLVSQLLIAVLGINKIHSRCKSP